MTAPTAEAKRRYTSLIEATLRAALAARLERPMPDGLTMELALPAIAARMGLIDRDAPSLQYTFKCVHHTGSIVGPVFDRGGHTRAFYRPLLMLAISPFYAAHPTSGGDFAKRAFADVLALASDPSPPSVSRGGSIASTLFGAISLLKPNLHFSGFAHPAAHAVFTRVVRSQTDDGRFLTRSSADQLEPAWYHELAVLHAVDLYARLTGEAVAREAVRRSARYHAEQVQPDHASSHPFGLAALLDDAEGIFLADMMLHAAGVQQPATMDAVSLVLLFDAIDAR